MYYVLVGGEVKSSFDGDIHYISPFQLAKLYGLDPSSPNVILCKDADELDIKTRGLEDFIVLHPRRDGNYNLFNAK